MEAGGRTIVIPIDRNTAVAYTLLVILGPLGLHRFYLDRPVTGVSMLVLGLLGLATVWVEIGFIFLIPLWIWQFIDLFLVPSMVREANRSL